MWLRNHADSHCLDRRDRGRKQITSKLSGTWIRTGTDFLKCEPSSYVEFLAWGWQIRVASSHLFPSMFLCLCPEEKKDLTLDSEYFLKYILKFIYYSWGQQTIAWWPNLACWPFVYGYFHFQTIEKKIRRRIVCNTWKLFEIQTSVSILKFPWNTAMFNHLCVVSSCFWTPIAQLSGCQSNCKNWKPKTLTIWLFIDLPTLVL